MGPFVQRLLSASRNSKSLVCVGLDPDPALMPIPDMLEFNTAIIESTKDLVCAYKPNLSFYEALGSRGLEVLEKTVSFIRRVAPGVVVVGDGKRGDVASTNVKYATALFDVWEFDAVTVNGYAGGEALEPFFRYGDRGVFVWCRSSNPGAREMQDLTLCSGAGTMPLYQWMAERASQWNSRGNVGLVVGSTYPHELRSVRSRCRGMPILLPGIGAQGGDLENCVRFGVDEEAFNVLVASSRSIIYASRDKRRFPDAAREATQDLRERINRLLAERGKKW